MYTETEKEFAMAVIKRETYSLAWPCRMRFGGVPVRVATPPTLAAYATHRAKPLLILFISPALCFLCQI